jgi:hypothetical protein
MGIFHLLILGAWKYSQGFTSMNNFHGFISMAFHHKYSLPGISNLGVTGSKPTLNENFLS